MFGRKFRPRLLDQDAISVLRKASPLALKHPLGKSKSLFWCRSPIGLRGKGSSVILRETKEFYHESDAKRKNVRKGWRGGPV